MKLFAALTRTDPVPVWICRWPRQYEWRHANLIAAIRVLAAVWLLILGSILCAYSMWWGAALYPFALLNAWAAIMLPRYRATLITQGWNPKQKQKRVQQSNER